MAFRYDGPNTVAQNLHPTMSVSPITIRGSIHGSLLPAGTSEFYVAHWDGQTLQSPAGVTPDLLLVTDASNIPDAALLGSRVLAFENAYTPQAQIDWSISYPDQVVNYHAGGIVVGSLGNDTITLWGNGDSMVEGGEGNDIIHTGTGNDIIASGKGNDIIDAGAGIDTVRLSGAITDYSHQVSDGHLQFTNTATSAVTTLSNVEIVGFGSQSIVIVDNQNDGNAMRLYEALLDRAPDAAGALYWLDQLDQGANPLDIANGFLNSQEFQAANTDASNTQFVGSLYEKALHRTVDADGAAYWEGQLTNGISRADVALAFVSSDEAVEKSQNVIVLNPGTTEPSTDITVVGQVPEDHSGHTMG
ncbi:DUF4214 domain-containing protein [Azomonas macrocytogenes]|uniref:Ca2+-binding RTX toxin-like protein n=1 Tax=Azomonas macrocytogenes TaxID=69962 RepID=A0A839T9L0_AZOMA|nr:DUF4214 domain-containing protein [Azomonas macrocytogenes]MBB3104323.1 Ca2+-binding RTX toxin-like protein [Azomonas macrocytogenes]